MKIFQKKAEVLLWMLSPIKNERAKNCIKRSRSLFKPNFPEFSEMLGKAKKLFFLSRMENVKYRWWSVYNFYRSLIPQSFT